MAQERRSPIEFSGVTDPRTFLVREHFENFSRAQNLSRMVVVKTLRVLMDGSANDEHVWIDYNAGVMREPMPLPGIMLASRESLGMPPFKRRDSFSSAPNAMIAQYGIEAGSLVDFSQGNIVQTLTPGVQSITLQAARLLSQQFMQT